MHLKLFSALSIASVFIASALVSCVGSLQLGPVNLFVINSVLYENKKTAYWIAAGGSLPEFVYCALAVYASSFFAKNPSYDFFFKVTFICVLIVLGFIFWFKPVKKVEVTKPLLFVNAPQSFAKGFSLALLNPQLLPFWLIVHIYFNSVSLLKTPSPLHEMAFVLGAGVGAFMLLISLIALVNKFKTTILKYLNTNYYYKILAIIFFAIAIQQFVLCLNLEIS